MKRGYAERLLATYPNATHAISWVELILCQRCPDAPDEPCSWEMMTTCCPPMTLDEILDTIRGCLANEVRENGPGKCREALAECDTPDFRHYLTGKLGMV